MIRIATLVAALAALQPSLGQSDTGLNQIEHIVVIYLENHSFDSLFGLFPGANGLQQAENALPQIDEYGRPYKNLPRVMNSERGKAAVIDKRFQKDLPNAPFDIGGFVPPDQKHPDLTHKFFAHQMQIDAGRNDRFAQLSEAGGLVMGHYDLSGTALWNYAKEYTLADNFFQAAFGGSFLNHQWLVCACTPVFPNAPDDFLKWKVDEKTGKLINEPSVTEEGFAVGTFQPYFQPFEPKYIKYRLPIQTHPTIGDRLSEKGISWAWYSGGWDNAVAGRKTDENFQYHHQPFAFYSNYAPGSAARAEHLKDESDLFSDLKSNELPQVVFFKPAGIENQHPGYSDIMAADKKVSKLVEVIRSNSVWQNTAIIVTYDEYGGFWDHVAPPVIDRWGPGSRIPAIIISPFAKKGYVDHTLYNTTSILKLIENRFDLQPLTRRDADANGLEGAFEFNR